MFWIGFTTRYREGSAKFARAAETLRAELARRHPGAQVLLEPLERKRDFVAAMSRLEQTGTRILELHFIGHSGMYGIMFGSTAWPEQLSPHEWRSLRIPFAEGATAHFHACRTARWFAPFFARTFGVRAYGHHGYTTVSLRPERFTPEFYRPTRSGPLYLISVPGRKTHGWSGAAKKYALRPRALPMLAFDPEPTPDASYDAVAESYDQAFADIRVRRDEWRWLTERLNRAFPDTARAPRVLDIGCGNGALLLGLADRIANGVGVDTSAAMIERATRRAANQPNLGFSRVEGPRLPFADASFDVVTSFLSFRYLDWDPILSEVRRVLAPGGRMLIVDMVEKTPTLRDTPQLLRSLGRHLFRHVRDRQFVENLKRLTAKPAWAEMVRHNPIRAVHEYRWYLESRFPSQKLATLNVSRRARLVAFDTGPLTAGSTLPLSYP